MIDHLISRALRRIRQAGHDIDSFILGRQRRRYLRNRISFTSEESQPLLEMLNRLFDAYGFDSGPDVSPDTPEMAHWNKSLGPTLKATLGITMHQALEPDLWSLQTSVMVDSTYAGHWHDKLRLYRDFFSAMPSYEDTGSLQVLRFNPAHIRWQERPELELPSLQGRPETLDALRKEFTEVCQHYLMPVLAQCDNPSALAAFQVRAETGLRCTRVNRDQPRYQVSNPAISTALLMDEAGETAQACAYLEQMREALSREWAAEEPAWKAPRLGRLDRLVDHLRNKAPAAAAGAA